MDTSETYIKMCEKAEEIQEQARTNGIEYGDYIYVTATNDFARYTGEVELVRGEKGYKYAPFGVIFIPRQDQLQEMVGEEYAINLLYQFHQYYNTKYREIPGNWSVEQLWLAFVMKEKYNKIWVDGNWVKQKVEAVK